MSDDSSNLNPIAQKRQLDGWMLGLFALIATIVIFFSSQTLGAVLVNLIPMANHWSAAETNVWLTNSTEAQFAYGLIADGLLVLGVAMMLRWFHWSWAQIGIKKPAVKHLAIGFLAAIPYYLLYVAIALGLSALIPSLNLNQKQDIGFDSVHGVLSLVLTFASLVIFPPLAEEITMRGFLYTGLKKWMPTVVAAVAVSALFGAAHLTEGGDAGPLWIGAIDTFTLSLVLVFLREKTGNLWAGIVLHATKNCVAFVMLFIIGSR